ncbi:MAG TPA: PqqD family peptide modification chaperone, partial [Kiloniellales bacterium]|nr:PqqD family peptide modification chaperone [Kiloniellales bacterium]
PRTVAAARMNGRPTTIGLCMIVKDEAHVLRRCVEAALPLLDYALIVDTGSSDGTPELARRLLEEHGLPGQVLNDRWRDFASNRTLAVEQLRAVRPVDYALMLDADDLLVIDRDVDPRSWKDKLQADVYEVALRLGNLAYTRPQLWRNRLPVRYRGVLHEFLELPKGATRAHASGIHIKAIQDSARNRNPQKYAEDAKVLATAAARETDPFMRSRYVLYEARCHESAGNIDAAIDAYRRRAKLGHWKEEVFISLVGVARLLERKGAPPGEVLAACLEAQEVMPERSEALHLAIRLCRLKRMHQAGWMLAQHAVTLPRPTRGLFLDTAVYDWRLTDEYALAAYNAGQYAESFRACEAMLASPKLPNQQRSRIKANADYARAKMEAASASPRPAASPQALPDDKSLEQPRLPAGVLGDGLVLAKPSSGRLFALNATGRFLWQGYLAGTAQEKLAAQLAEGFGLSPEEAGREAAETLARWRAEGLIDGRDDVLRIALGHQQVELSCDSAEVKSRLAALLPASTDAADGKGAVHFTVRGQGPFLLLQEDRPLAQLDSVDAVVERLLPAVRDLLYQSLPWRLAVPGAAVSCNGGAILIPGAEAAGPSSLAGLLLQEDDCELLADDLVLFSGEEMRVEPLALSQRSKREATEPRPRPARQAMRLSAIVIPAARPGAAPYSVPLTPAETLDALLKASCRARPPVTSQSMAHLVSWIGRLPAWQVVHDDPLDAKALVLDLLRR